jgi:hypothetical protein
MTRYSFPGLVQANVCLCRDIMELRGLFSRQKRRIGKISAAEADRNWQWRRGNTAGYGYYDEKDGARWINMFEKKDPGVDLL